MAPFYRSLCAIFLCILATGKAVEVPFTANYQPEWGADHLSTLDQGRQVRIRIDPHSGGGFISRKAFGSGHFQMKIKIPRKAKGIVTTFYLTSFPNNVNHDELDFEFLGGDGAPYILNTNVFAQDSGNREQQFKLWFDPSADFHQYELLWNQHQIVFFVDGTPIRVYKNHVKEGARYPKLPMKILATLWDAKGWLGPVNWSQGPFLADYREFEIQGCPYDNGNPTKCNSPNYSWNEPTNWQLNAQQEKLYQMVREKNMIYDYCKGKNTNNFPECRVNL